MNGVLLAQTTSFEDAIPALTDTLVLDRARRVIAAQAEDLDDLLAGGATLEEVAAESDMVFDMIDFNDLSDAGIAGYPAFRETAEDATVDDYPQIEELGDGGIYAMRLNDIVPATPQPFEDVRDAVIAGWRADQELQALEREGVDIQTALADGQSFEALALDAQAEQNIDRQSFTTDMPRSVLDGAFDLDIGDARVVTDDTGVYVLRLDGISAPDMSEDRNQQALELYGQQASLSVQDDLIGILASEIQQRAGVSVNQAAIDAIDAGLQ